MTPQNPDVLLSCFPDLECPLADLLRIKQRNQVERECREVVHSIVGEVADSIEREELELSLTAMREARQVFHYPEPTITVEGTAVDDPLRCTFVHKDFVQELTGKAKHLYLERVMLQCDMHKIALVTRGQAKTKR